MFFDLCILKSHVGSWYESEIYASPEPGASTAAMAGLGKGEECVGRLCEPVCQFSPSECETLG